MNLETEQMVSLIKEYVRFVDPKAQVILYGSRARGDSHTDSDWDILILTDNTVDLVTEKRFRDKLYDLELETGEAISVFIYSKKEWETKQRISPFYENVTQEGIRL